MSSFMSEVEGSLTRLLLGIMTPWRGSRQEAKTLTRFLPLRSEAHHWLDPELQH